MESVLLLHHGALVLTRKLLLPAGRRSKTLTLKPKCSSHLSLYRLQHPLEKERDGSFIKQGFSWLMHHLEAKSFQKQQF